MKSKTASLATSSVPKTTTIVSDLWTSRQTLAPNEYSSATIGIHNYLVRSNEHEPIAKFFYEGSPIDRQTQDYINQLNKQETKCNEDCLVNAQRCAIIARLRFHLEKNEQLFKNLLKQIKEHLNFSMLEYIQPPTPRTYAELSEQCRRQCDIAEKLDETYRKQRFQFYAENDLNIPINMISLQTWFQSIFQTFASSITPNCLNQKELLSQLDTLIDNSFIIVQHPSLPIVTNSPAKNNTVSATIACRLLTLLNKDDPCITIEDITPVVCCLSNRTTTEKISTMSYPQSQISWESYSILTTSNRRQQFFAIDLSKIVLSQTSTTKAHYSPCMYYLEFRIVVKVYFINDSTPYQRKIVIRSAPFGLIANTSQLADLFSEVFIEDLKSLISLVTERTNKTSTVNTPKLTLPELVDSIRRYFIHKTGIYPRPWVVPYIEKELATFSIQGVILTSKTFHNTLAKILAQIDYMSANPILSLFHEDGLFFGIYGNNSTDEFLREQINIQQCSLCLIRFGLIHNMCNAKDIGVRLETISTSKPKIGRYTLSAEHFSMEIGSLIVRIASQETLHFEKVLTNFNVVGEKLNNPTWSNTYELISSYYSEKLKKLCPCKTDYDPIQFIYGSKENDNPDDTKSTTKPVLSQNSLVPIAPRTHTSNYKYPPVPPSYIPIDQHINPTPVFVVITAPNQYTLSQQDITQIISNNLPQYSSLLPSARIHLLNVIVSPPLSSIPVEASPDFSSINPYLRQNTIHQSSTSDSMDISDSNEKKLN